ncbi:hypothetical protein EDB89DRAFT_2043983 [Lactarius sanguifluus]|nr:hypothetical protein EDB89DRAFT_2043983 [Lactarius sanguifluus]
MLSLSLSRTKRHAPHAHAMSFLLSRLLYQCTVVADPCYHRFLQVVNTTKAKANRQGAGTWTVEIVLHAAPSRV